MPKPPSDWISLSEAADVLAAANVRFTPGTIGRWARTGHLQSIKLGNKRYVRRTQIRALLRPHGATHLESGEQPVLFTNLDGTAERPGWGD
jgi:hypothetical protein